MTNAIIHQQPLQIQTQADTDDQLIELWLHGKSKHSVTAYRRHIARLEDFVVKPLQQIKLVDLQDFADSLTGSDNSKKQAIAAVKSLFTFGQKLGYLQFNVAAALKTPKPKNKLAERILSESEVLTMIGMTTKERDKALLTLLYASGGRVSEICALAWADVQQSGESGQVTLYGKGGDTRAVKLSAKTWAMLQDLRNGASSDQPVFASQMGGHMVASRVWQIVREAAQRAGIKGKVSPHWFRHSHATHALERGANIKLVQETLGHSSLQVTSRYTHARPDQSSALHLAV